MLSLPQLVVAKLVTPVMEQPQDATGTSAALFFIAPPLSGRGRKTPSAAPVTAAIASERPDDHRRGRLPIPHRRASIPSRPGRIW